MSGARGVKSGAELVRDPDGASMPVSGPRVSHT